MCFGFTILCCYFIILISVYCTFWLYDFRFWFCMFVCFCVRACVLNDVPVSYLAFRLPIAFVPSISLTPISWHYSLTFSLFLFHFVRIVFFFWFFSLRTHQYFVYIYNFLHKYEFYWKDAKMMYECEYFLSVFGWYFYRF